MTNPPVWAEIFNELCEPLKTFKDHRTYPAAVRAIQRVYTTEGHQAAKARVAEFVELFEDVFLRDKLNPLG